VVSIGPGVPDDGFHEVRVIVDDLESAAHRLCDAYGYQMLWSGEAVEGAIRLLGFDPIPAREILIGDAMQGRGFLRLIAFPGLSTGVMRDGAQPWDIGGLFDLNIRPLVPIETVHAATTRAGFCAFAPITAYVFDSLAVKQVVSRDSDGVAIALIERVSPPLEGFEAVKGPTSYVFNSSQIVPSLNQARAFYGDVLGWTVVQQDEWVHPGHGRNCLGLPLDVARTRRIKVAIFHPQGAARGSVEAIEIEGEALNFSTAAPPDRGLAALRFPVSDVETFLAKCARGGCRILAPTRFRLEPYGEVLAGAAVTPWGVRLEAYQSVSD
jgi:catechol 2,3-dioxygenase-like lactoylglutathione lyase family enzyme